MTCAKCGASAPEVDETQPWCNACCETGEIIVDNINSGDEDESEVAA